LLERSLELSGYVLVKCDAQLGVLASHGACEGLVVAGRLEPSLAEAVQTQRATARLALPCTLSGCADFRLVQIDEGPAGVLVWLRRVAMTRSAFGQLLRQRYGFKLRSQQLLLLLTQGFKNREIAERLGLREATVKTYLHDVYETLGVRSRTAALAELRRSLVLE
jgi:DNA-binding NarL/FixJ family response regulator